MRASSSGSVVLACVAMNLLFAGSAEAVKRRVFATSVSGSGDLSSWPGATGSTAHERGDAICEARAAAAGLPDAATYRVWLSTSTTDAYCHLIGKTGQKATGCTGGPPVSIGGPWYLVDGSRRFSGNIHELTGPEQLIYRPVGYDEFGSPLSGWESSKVWTGTLWDGTAYLTCDDWTNGGGLIGSAGNALTSTQLWAHSAIDLCVDEHRLLCLEPGLGEITPSTWPTAASIVFLTSVHGIGELGSWPESGGETGLDAGDAICRNLAASAHLPDPSSFVAWLSDSVEHARDRLTSAGPYRRIDGIGVANTEADLTDGTLDSTIHVDEWGHYLAVAAGAFTGTSSLGMTLGGDNCDDWTEGTDGSTAGYGLPAIGAHFWWTAESSTTCNASLRLYCFSNRVVLFWDGFDYSGDTTRWSDTAP